MNIDVAKLFLFVPLLLPVAMLVTTIILLWLSRSSRRPMNRGVDPSTQLSVTAFIAKTVSREVVRIVLDRYRNSTAEFNDAPSQAEYLTQLMVFAIAQLRSRNRDEVVAGLQTLGALGTHDLLHELADDFQNLEIEWKGSNKIQSMILLTKESMAVRLNGKQSIMIVGDKPLNGDLNSIYARAEATAPFEVTF